MKKFMIIMLLTFSFLFSFPGCSSQENPPLPESEIPAEEQPAASEEKAENSGREKSIILDVENEIEYTEWKKEFEKRNISVKIQNVSLIDENHWEGEFFLENSESGKSLSIPITGTSAENAYFSTMFGGFSFINDHTAAYCGKEKAFFFNLWRMEEEDFKPKLLESGEYEIWVNGAGYDFLSEKYVIILTKLNCPSEEKGETLICYYGHDGELSSSAPLDIRGSIERNSLSMPWFFEDTQIFELGEETFLFADYGFTSLESGEKYNAEFCTFAENEWNKVEIYNFYKPGEDEIKDKKYIAFLYGSGYLTDCFAFREDNLSAAYSSEIKEETSLFGDYKNFVYYSDYFAMTLELDFENESHNLLYNPTDKHTGGGMGTKSSDGKYTICYFGETGGGDAFFSHCAIRHNDTGKYIYLNQRGGMWGGYGGTGFFKNNDVYVYSTGMMQVIDPETGKIKFDMSKNFPLGYDEETNSERGLLAFRRDPNDFGYIVVYYEYENGYESEEAENEFGGWHYEYDFNYKIGFLDSEGRLLESYDTGMPFFSNHFGINSVDMYYTPEAITLTVRGGKAESGFIGTFDMKTHEFSAVPLENG